MSNEYNFMTYKTSKFDVNIDASQRYGFFEHHDLGDEYGGGLWFNENMKLIDYDGVYELPTEVEKELIKLNYLDWDVLQDY